jgi:hypothetical protein
MPSACKLSVRECLRRNNNPVEERAAGVFLVEGRRDAVGKPETRAVMMKPPKLLANGGENERLSVLSERLCELIARCKNQCDCSEKQN